MLPAKTFHMIRHGETVMNAARLACGGGVDTELNDEGRRQAFAAAKVLEALNEKPTHIIHSGMKRTIETTAILNAALKLPVSIDPDLREHMLGELERKPWDTVYPTLRTGAKPAGGESLDDYAGRVLETFRRILTAHASERLLIVAHGGTFHAFQRMHGQKRRIFIPNATLHRFDPESAHSPMPWRVSMIEWREKIYESPAPICPSQPDPAEPPSGRAA